MSACKSRKTPKTTKMEAQLTINCNEPQYVYFYGFGSEHTEGNAGMKALLGGKGANLAEMAQADLPVPPGFTISTEACAHYSSNSHVYPLGLAQQIKEKLNKLEMMLGKKLGDANDPLLVSVRSGAAASMPGMMDTVLNLGLTDESVKGFIAQTNNARAGWDCYRRFIDMFGDVVMGPVSGLCHADFENAMIALKKRDGVIDDTDLSADQLEELVETFKGIYLAKVGTPFPQDPHEQLDLAIKAVFNSWDSERATKYRQINKINGLLGTAVNICSMVYGNMGEDSGTGVAFTRNGATGENTPMGEYLINAQGEDVVAGIRTPRNLDDMVKEPNPLWGGIHSDLNKIMRQLERHYKYPQDVEFTIERGKLWMLQTRNAKRTGIAGVRWATEMATGKDFFTDEQQDTILTPAEALTTITGEDVEQLLFHVFDTVAEAAASVIATGLPAGPGAAVGKIVFTAEDAEELIRQNPDDKLILVRQETSPEDVGGMWAAQGILTSTGGMTSHAAVVARGWGKCCICGVHSISIDEQAEELKVGNTIYKKGDYISLNGSTGCVYAGEIPTRDSAVVDAIVHNLADARKDPVYLMYKQLSDWSDSFRKINVRTNADSPKDAAAARAFGAEGIGLCRTEHMFFEGERIWNIREFILSDSKSGRRSALEKLLPFQRNDFEGIFNAMDGLPVTIRLLDPPLHEFLPQTDKDQRAMAERLNVKLSEVKSRVKQLHELNPMLGHRGCRLSVTYPELCEMQVHAIIEAAINVEKKGIVAKPEIMIPLVGIKAELDFLADIVRTTADKLIESSNSKLTYHVGTMIEVPRAALTAGQIAETAEFFSFGTNDLTQMTYGFSRDDIGSFLPHYLERKIMPADPFQTLDQTGVGELIKLAVERGRATRPGIKCGICGEHGGDPESVKFCTRVGLDYVSCSPFRVTIARLAAAQAAIESQ